MNPTLLEQLSRYKLTFGIIILNLIVYAISAMQSGSIVDMDIEVLVELGALFGPKTVLASQWQDLVTAMFLHSGMTHILMNMFSLYLIGRSVEEYFSISAYLSLYLFSGMIGALVSLYMHPGSVGVGASGAIFGLFGALAGFFLAHRSKIEAHTKAFMKDFAVILGINLVIGFSIESIDVSAHIGGLAVGIIGGYMIAKNPKVLGIFSVAMGLVMFAIIHYLPTQYAQMLF